MKKVLQRSIVFLIVFFGCAGSTYASVTISEIMYNSEGSDIDWIEIHNSGESAVDVTGLKLLISNSPSNHAINGYAGSKTLPANGYSILTPSSTIGAFVSKYPQINSVFTSSFSLPNVKDQDSIKIEINNGDKNIPLSSISYSASFGGDGNGLSLQKNGSLWKQLLPTPGLVNQESTSSNSSNQNSSESSDSYRSVSENTKKESSPSKITTTISAKNIFFAGIDSPIGVVVRDSKGSVFNVGRFIWNFGDGTRDEKQTSESFSHVYQYPGEYILTVAFYTQSLEPDAGARTTIKVIPTDLRISSIGRYTDPYIEIQNGSSYEMDLSGFFIRSGQKSFVIPEGTIVLSKGKLKFSPNITGFTGNDIISAVIVGPNGKIISPESSRSNVSSHLISQEQEREYTSVDSPIKTPSSDDAHVIDLTSMGASALDSVQERDTSRPAPSTFSWIGLAVVVILGVVAVIVIGRKTLSNKDDREIRAEDITLVE